MNNFVFCVLTCLVPMSAVADEGNHGADIIKSQEAFPELPWTHHLILDHENKFHVFWLPSEKDITFELRVETRGYVALGFSPNGGMKGSDIALAWVDDEGQLHLKVSFKFDRL